MPDAAKIASVIEAVSGSESAPGGVRPPTPVEEASSGADSASDAPSTSSDNGDAAASEATKTRHEILSEKLAEARARRQGRREVERLKAERAQVDADRKAAAEEKAKWDDVRRDYKTGLPKMGLNAREVYEEMTRQAVEAGTPEAQLKAMQTAWEDKLTQTVGPLKETIEALKAENERINSQAQEREVVQAFSKELADPSFVNLRVEYEDEQILGFVRHFIDHPQKLISQAQRLGVRLTAPERGFTMREALEVLRSAQDEHQKSLQQRRERLQSQTAQQAVTRAPTVNGTAERRNAGTIGNDLASSRASGDRPKLTRKERIQKLIDEAG